MRIGGRLGARPAVAAVRKWGLPVTRAQAFSVAVISPLVFAGAVGATPEPIHGKSPIPSVHAVITPVAAVSPTVPDLSGPVVIAIDRAPTAFHVAAGAASAPPPPRVVSAPGALGIPMMALTAYRNAEQKMAVSDPACGVSWNLLAGIGRIESGHASGGAVDSRGTAVTPIYGPSLDGTLPGNEVIISSSAGNRVTYARALGPMQFLPGTWARYAADGDGDGVADPQNLFDSTLTAARYLCSGALNLRDPAQVMAAILRYNNSTAYAQNVLGWAAAYATGVVPVDLPPITGPPPPLGNAHDEHPEGLGPGLPINMIGLPQDDPLARMPLIDLTGLPPQASVAPPPMFPWMTPPPSQAPTTGHMPGCTVICISSQTPPTGGPQLGPQGFAPQAPPPFAPQAPPPFAPQAPAPFAPQAPAPFAPQAPPPPANPAPPIAPAAQAPAPPG
ncbi:lytic murein transglycosylase [Mycobacterium sp. Aquia_216]|uniref:lytic transglycosylase domain-containing protein n=1 Tax=Mycobacterium sp. Aquia_216 TaxID=2991729 RepID=UPI00227A22A5|nr:lytic murein transglycosylase [Mycobacterium sp. Aquia_216]WAJ44013.1 lytic murein transglycosylase [Mycobacterium sp. Aquia_216]